MTEAPVAGSGEATTSLLHDGIALTPRLQEVRRLLHAAPEVGLHLPRTQQLVLDELDGLGLDLHRGDELSSVVAVLRGARPGPTVLLRADMDALPLTEDTGLPWAATNGAMHACGHDLHMSGLLGAARLLCDRRAEIAGTVVLAFQPGEEGHGGGRLMVEDGLMDITGERALACYAFHVTPGGPAGTVRAKAGSVMAGMNEIRVEIVGLGGHASAPHTLRDPVPVLAEVTLALQTWVTRRIHVADPVVLTVTQLRAGTSAVNVVADRAALTASLRVLSADALDRVRAEIPSLVENIARGHGCTAEIEILEMYPVTANDPIEAEYATAALTDLLGPELVVPLEFPLMASEDFSFMLQQTPGAFLLLEAGDPDRLDDPGQQLHSAQVRFDDSRLGEHAAALAHLALSRLAHEA